MKYAHLYHNDCKEKAHGHGDITPDENHHAAGQLKDHVHQYEHMSEKLAAAPRKIDVVLLLAPLEPHSEPVLQEGGDEAETSEVREIVLRVAENAVRHIVSLRKNFVVCRTPSAGHHDRALDMFR